MKSVKNYILLFLMAFSLSACATASRRLCSDGSSRSVPVHCKTDIKYRPPSIEWGIFDLPVVYGVPVPYEIDGSKIAPEIVQLIAEGVKAMDLRRKHACAEIQKSVCGMESHVYREDMVRIDRALRSLTGFLSNFENEENLKEKAADWSGRFMIPDRYFKYLQDGDNLLAQEKYEEAAAKYREVLSLKELSPAYYRLGWAYTQMIDADPEKEMIHLRSAIESFMKCYLLDQGNLTCVYNVARLNADMRDPKQGNLVEAQKLFRFLKQQDLSPYYKDHVNFYLGVLAVKRSDFATAQDRFLETLSSKGADLFLKVFSRYYLAFSHSLMSLRAEDSSRSEWIDQAAKNLVQALDLAGESGGNELHNKLDSLFRRDRDTVFIYLHSNPRWEQVIALAQKLRY